MKTFIPIILTLTVIVAAGCNDPTIKPPEQESPEDLAVKANAALVQAAAEAFNAEELSYPNSLAHQTQSGKTLIDFLPNGERLENPYTGQKTEPVDGPLPTSPGQIEYTPGCPPTSCSWQWAFTVEGNGQDEVIVTLEEDWPSKEEIVIANAEAIIVAVEAFAAENSGLYPQDVGVDTTPQGNTLIDLLPKGHLMDNPFTYAATEPVDGSAATPGQCGYVVIRDNGGQRVGYVVNGYGKHDIIVERIKDPT